MAKANAKVTITFPIVINTDNYPADNIEDAVAQEKDLLGDATEYLGDALMYAMEQGKDIEVNLEDIEEIK